MYRISQLARLTGLSRSTLLYYEKLGLLRAQRQHNGYRSYAKADLQRLLLLQQLQAGGLTLKECLACLDAQLDRQLLQARLQQLDDDIAAKQQARDLLAGLLGYHSATEPARRFHQQASQLAPDAHFAWLQLQGFTEKQALQLKWLSRDMHQHEQYMVDFMAVYQALARWAPGHDDDSRRALTLARAAAKPDWQLQQILDIGCGKGFSTTLLARETDAQIVATDNEPAALAALAQRLDSLGLASKVQLVDASMTALPFSPHSFDLLWAEGSAYIMGVAGALQSWQPLLRPQGVLVFSDLVWLTDSPAAACQQYWQQQYPDMQTVAQRRQLIKKSGYQLVGDFTLSELAWQQYYQPLATQLAAVTAQLPDSTALADIKRELEMYQQYHTQYGYQMFVLRLPQ